jgi:hypothetical protein
MSLKRPHWAVSRGQDSIRWDAIRTVEQKELKDDEALAKTICFSEEAQRLHNFFPTPSSAFATEGQEKRRSVVMEDMLRIAETLFPEVLLLRAKDLKFVIKAFEAGDLAYGGRCDLVGHGEGLKGNCCQEFGGFCSC